MEATKLKKILAGLHIAGLLAGSGLLVHGCTKGAGKDKPPAETVQKEQKNPEIQKTPTDNQAAPGPDTGKKIRGKSG